MADRSRLVATAFVVAGILGGCRGTAPVQNDGASSRPELQPASYAFASAPVPTVTWAGGPQQKETLRTTLSIGGHITVDHAGKVTLVKSAPGNLSGNGQECTARPDNAQVHFSCGDFSMAINYDNQRLTGGIANVSVSYEAGMRNGACTRYEETAETKKCVAFERIPMLRSHRVSTPVTVTVEGG